MTVTLHLGVLDVPYVEHKGLTTGDVAEFIEAKYGLLEAFAGAHLQEIADDMAEGVAGAIENLLLGAPATDPFAAAMSKTADRMRQFVTSGEAESLVPGAPTQAALDGVNHRLKIKRGARRPSFVDTSLMISSYKAWVEGDL